MSGLLLGGMTMMLAVMGGAVSCGYDQPAPAARPTPALGGRGASPRPLKCLERGSGLYVLPDPICTPGATNPAVSQATIESTICRVGWTAQVRPSQSYTEAIKAEQMVAYGESGPLRSYEEDHLIPLELGGASEDPANLWPEPGASPNPKDGVENAARRAVCEGSLGLVAAQRAITSNWIALGQRLGVGTTMPASLGTRRWAS